MIKYVATVASFKMNLIPGIPDFQGDLTDTTAKTNVLTVLSQSSNLIYAPVHLFSKLNKLFFGYLKPENIFLDNKNK